MYVFPLLQEGIKQPQLQDSFMVLELMSKKWQEALRDGFNSSTQEPEVGGSP